MSNRFRPLRTQIPAALLFVWTVNMFGQIAGKISGSIVDQTSHTPIPFVNITVEGTKLGASSKLDGSFIISRVPAGTYKLTASAVGYSRVVKEISVHGKETAKIIFEITEVTTITEEVVVTARTPISAASSSTISALDFELRPKQSTQDLLRMVPGLFIAQHAGGGKAEQIFLRGFDADHGTDVNISLDGIPVNMVSHGHGQGYADLHFVMPEVLEGMTVYKGPYFAQFGDFATAGSVQFTTVDEIDDNTLSAEAGTFELERVSGMAQIPLATDQTTAFAAGEIFHNRSYFEHSLNFDRYNLFGKVKTYLGDSQTLSLWASGFSSSWDASGQIPERAVEEGIIGRYGSIDPSEGGNTYRQNINLIYTHPGESSTLIAQAYASRYNFQLFSDFTFFANDPVNGDEIEQDDRRTLAGGRVEYTTTSFFNDPAATTLFGSTIRNDWIHNALWHVVKRQRLRDSADADIRQTNFALYAQQDYRLSSFIKFQLGLRADNFLFDVNDLLHAGTPSSISGIVNQSIFSPKANIIISASSTTDVFLNFGTGFHSNDARVVLAQRSDITLPRAVGAEVGTRYTPNGRFTASIAFWGLDLQREFVYSGDDGTTEEEGPTRRIGIDFDNRMQLLDWLWSDIDINYSHGRFRDLPDGSNFIPLAPTLSSTGGLTARHSSGLEGSFRYRSIDSRPANDDNSVGALGYTVFDANVAYNFEMYRVMMTVENVFNVEWNEAQFYTVSRLQNEPAPVPDLDFTPGTSRVIRLSFSTSF
jgi:CarboxypepD_reg-like domain/TonB-dependent Receptor Plug Domain